MSPHHKNLPNLHLPINKTTHLIILI